MDEIMYMWWNKITKVCKKFRKLLDGHPPTIDLYIHTIISMVFKAIDLELIINKTKCSEFANCTFKKKTY